jgi:hypothetical protein
MQGENVTMSKSVTPPANKMLSGTTSGQEVSKSIPSLNGDSSAQEKTISPNGKHQETIHMANLPSNETTQKKKQPTSTLTAKQPHRFSRSSLLSTSYVPKKLRTINESQVTCIIPTLEPPKSEFETRRVFQGLTGLPMPCQCVGKDCHALPTKILVAEEQEFARKQAGKRKGAPIPPITMASGRDAYIQTFRELMQLEYEKQHCLFARYSQYEVKITTDSLPREANQPLPKEPELVAKFRVPGIADGRPSLQKGDLVFIRPHSMVPNPYHLKAVYPALSPQNAPPPIIPFPGTENIPFHRTEIQSRVVSVTRGKLVDNEEQRKDLVVISWGIDPLLASSILSDSRKSLFTIRFVPSTNSHERTLTAFRWLDSLHPTIARDLLFPTETPKLPPAAPINENGDAYDSLELEYMQLNDNQSKFVQMMIIRTANPVKEKIRPPMVLTGPAGTGA